MDLDVIDVFQSNAVAHGNGQGVARKVREIRRMVVKAADTAAGQDRVAGFNGPVGPVLFAGQDAETGIAVGKDVDHGRKITDCHVRKGSDGG